MPIAKMLDGILRGTGTDATTMAGRESVSLNSGVSCRRPSRVLIQVRNTEATDSRTRVRAKYEARSFEI